MGRCQVPAHISKNRNNERHVEMWGRWGGAPRLCRYPPGMRPEDWSSDLLPAKGGSQTGLSWGEPIVSIVSPQQAPCLWEPVLWRRELDLPSRFLVVPVGL